MGQDLTANSPSWCEGGEVEGGRRDRARVVVTTPWSYHRSGDKGLPTTMFHGWGWAAPMYNDMKISDVVRVLEHNNLHK